MLMRIKLAALVLLMSAAALSPAADIARLRNGFTIRHERRQVIGETTRLFLGKDRTSFVDIPTAAIEGFEHDESVPATASPAPAKGGSVQVLALSDVIRSASDRYRLDPDLVNSVIHAESGFNPNAVSHKGAQGLMQLMPQTAGKLGVTNSLDPQENVEGGTRYLRELLERYNFDLIKALAAYNAGPHRVERYGGVPPYRETRAYVRRIVKDFNNKKIAERQQAPKKAAGPKAAVPGKRTRAPNTEVTVRGPKATKQNSEGRMQNP